MAKSNSRRRVTNVNANRRLPFSPSPSVVSPSFPTSLRLYEDRRNWHPDPVAPARSFSQSRHRLTVVDRTPRQNSKKNFLDRFAHLRSFPSQTKAAIAFQAPEKVLVCVRRQMRKEVLHARKKAGKRGQRKPRFNAYSRISCKRRK